MTKQTIIASALAALALAVATLPGATAVKAPDLDVGGGGGGNPLPAEIGITVDGAGQAVGILVGAVGGAGTAECSGDPCAHTQCTSGQASAYAQGSELASASATVGSSTSSQSQPGAAAAAASGSGASSATAQGKRDWSFKEANSSCSSGSANSAAALGIAFGCVASDAIQASATFAGRLFRDAAGAIVAVDGSGLGLPVPSDFVVGGSTLHALGPVDGSGLTALDAVLSIELVNTENALGCSVQLS